MRKVLLLLFLMAITTAVKADAAFKIEENGQTWLTYGIQVPLHFGINLKIEEELKYKNDSSEHYYKDTYVKFGKKFGWLDTGVGYEHILEHKSGVWTLENRPQFELTPKLKLQSFFFSLRNRMQWRLNEEDVRQRYRLRVKAEHKSYVTVYIGEEFFYYLEGGGLNKTRASIGIKKTFLKTYQTGIFYLLEGSKSASGWKNTRVCGFNISVKFGG